MPSVAHIESNFNADFNADFNVASISLIGFGSDDQFAIKYKNLERTTLITLVCNLV